MCYISNIVLLRACGAYRRLYFKAPHEKGEFLCTYCWIIVFLSNNFARVAVGPYALRTLPIRANHPCAREKFWSIVSQAAGAKIPIISCGEIIGITKHSPTASAFIFP